MSTIHSLVSLKLFARKTGAGFVLYRPAAHPGVSPALDHYPAADFYLLVLEWLGDSGQPPHHHETGDENQKTESCDYPQCYPEPGHGSFFLFLLLLEEGFARALS